MGNMIKNNSSKNKVKNRKHSSNFSGSQQYDAPPSPPPPQNNFPSIPRTRVRALFRYEGQHPDDLPFEKGDLMCIHGDCTESWWFAENMVTHQRGYIPSNYVAVDDGKPTSLDAWFDISRREADRMLLLAGNPSGTYLIRPSSDPRHFALSVRHEDKSRKFVVKHYKIRSKDFDGGYYISTRSSFPVIADLIESYSRNADGLCCRLTTPFPRQYRPPVQFRDLEIHRDSIVFIKNLGQGSFGEVKLAKLNNTVDVAVKLLKPNSMERDKFIAEAQRLHRLHHKQIVQILGICTEPIDKPVYIVTELMEKGALLSFLKSPEGRSMQLTNLIDIMAQVAEGMSYLESMNFVHRDLRAANILVGEDLGVKVADFGLARDTEDAIYLSEEGAKFPIKWTAPEASSRRIFSVKSDVWSFGILMYEIVTFGCTPYPNMNNRETMEEVSRGYRMPMPEGPCTKELYQIMMNCWREHPDERPTFAFLQDAFDNWATRNDTNYTE